MFRGHLHISYTNKGNGMFWLCGWLKSKKKMEPEDREVVERTAMMITGQFEGAGWGGVAGNFDGQGLSAGVLQWNFGQGTLQQLLLKYQATYGDIPRKYFPKNINPLAYYDPVEAVEFAKKFMLDDEGDVMPRWERAWDRFLTTDRGKAVQTAMSRPYLEKAEAMMIEAGMNSTRTFCFFFDVAVQNGSMKGVKVGRIPNTALLNMIIRNSGSKNKELWEKAPMSVEQTILLLAAYDRSRLSNPRWVLDVMSRKGTIAVGQGIVHGKKYDFNRWFKDQRNFLP